MNEFNTTSGSPWTTTENPPRPSSGRVFWHPTVVGSSSIGNPYLYTGREFEGESGLYHFRARGYDACTGRYLQRDPLGFADGLSLYEMLRSRPSVFKDPLGMQTTEFETALALVASAQRAFDEAEQREKDARAHYKDLEKELAKASSAAKQLEEELKNKKKELEACRNGLTGSRIRGLEEAIAKLEDDKSKCEDELRTLRQECDAAADAMRTATDEKIAARNSLKDAERMLKKYWGGKDGTGAREHGGKRLEGPGNSQLDLWQLGAGSGKMYFSWWNGRLRHLRNNGATLPGRVSNSNGASNYGYELLVLTTSDGAMLLLYANMGSNVMKVADYTMLVYGMNNADYRIGNQKGLMNGDVHAVKEQQRKAMKGVVGGYRKGTFR